MINNKQCILLVALGLLFVTNIFAQRPSYQIRSYLGIQGGITQFDILTDNFNTKAETGFMGGLTAVGNIEHKWYNISYGIQFVQNRFSLEGRETQDLAAAVEDIKFQMSGAQLAVLFHGKLNRDNFWVDFGPVLQFNGELELQDKSRQEDFYVVTNENELIIANDLKKISKFNVNLAAGITAGFKNFKIRGQYQYGVTNLLGKLNDENLSNTKFKGNGSMISGTVLFLF